MPSIGGLRRPSGLALSQRRLGPFISTEVATASAGSDNESATKVIQRFGGTSSF
jgi:hypothetical protein